VDRAEYLRIASAEESHWWYRGTRSLIRQLLAAELRPGMRVLDAGCGPGGNSAWLTAENQVVGVDVSPDAVRLARERHPGMEVRQADIVALPFAEAEFDLALVITVLALVDDDALAVREVSRVLRPGGATFLIEPASPRLRRDHDAVTHIRRRYSLARLRELTEAAGLTVSRATYAYSFLVPAAAALTLWHRMKPSRLADHSDLERDRLGCLFGCLAAAERKVLRNADIPFGLSAVVVAKRPVPGAQSPAASAVRAAQIRSSSRSSSSG
jgi:ubiquinone/menaquinone biosynthesis C-methylase UbiE